MAGTQRNSVSLLTEYCQKIKHKLPTFTHSEAADNKEGRWEITVSVQTAEGEPLGECSASAANKNEAKKLAAQAWLDKFSSSPAAPVSDATTSVKDVSASQNDKKAVSTDGAQAGKRKRRLIEIHCHEHEKLAKLQELMQNQAPSANFSSVVFARAEQADSILSMLREDAVIQRLGLHADVVHSNDSDTTSFRSAVEAAWRGTTAILVACPNLRGDLIPPDCRLIVQFAPQGEIGVRAGRRFKVYEVEVKSFCGGAFHAAHALHPVFLPHPLPDSEQDATNKDTAPAGGSPAPLAENKQNSPRPAEPGRSQPAQNGPTFKSPYAVPIALRIADVSSDTFLRAEKVALHVHALRITAVDCDCGDEAEPGAARAFCVVAGQELAGVGGMTLHPPFPHRCQHVRRVRVQYVGVEHCDRAQLLEGVRYFKHTETAVSELCAREEEEQEDGAGEEERAAVLDWDGMAFGLPFREEGAGVDWDAVASVNAWFQGIASRKKKKARREEALDALEQAESAKKLEGGGGTLLWARYLNARGKLSDWRAFVYSRRVDDTLGSKKPNGRFASRAEWATFYAELKAEAEKDGKEVPAEHDLPVHERYFESIVEVLQALQVLGADDDDEAWHRLKLAEAWPLADQPKSLKRSYTGLQTPAPFKLIPAAALCHVVPLPALALCLPAVVASLHRLALPLELTRSLLADAGPPPRLLLPALTTPQSTAISGGCAPYLLPPVSRSVDAGAMERPVGNVAAAAAAEEEEEWVDEDYQGLEFLGDALVQVAVVLSEIAARPDAGQQRLAAATSQRVSNRTLERRAASAGLHRFILNQNKPFLPGREPGQRFEASAEREVAPKNCADVLEAVLGACWLADPPDAFFSGRAWRVLAAAGVVADPDAVPQRLAELRQRVAAAPRTAPPADAWPEKPSDEEQARCLGHVVRRTELLAAATLHASAEGESGWVCAVLVVLGDAALKASLAHRLFAHTPRRPASPELLTDARAGLWCSEALCRAAVAHGWHRWLRCPDVEQHARWKAEEARYVAALERGGAGGAVGCGTEADAAGVGVEEPRALSRAVRKVIGAVLLDSVLEHGLAKAHAATHALLGPLLHQRVLAPARAHPHAASQLQDVLPNLNGGGVAPGQGQGHGQGARGPWVNGSARLEKAMGRGKEGGAAAVEYEWLGCAAGTHVVQAWVDGRKAGEAVRGNSFFAAKMRAAAAALQSLGL